MKLASKISLTMTGVLVLAALASGTALLVARDASTALRSVVTENVASVRAAEELELALLEQRGFVSSYILDHGDAKWLAELELKKESFYRWLAKAEASTHTAEEEGILRSLRAVYAEYDQARELVITLYNRGETDEATRAILGDVRLLYERAYAICESFLAANERFIETRSAEVETKLRNATATVAAMFVLTIACGALLLALFFRGILRPLRRMTDDARAFRPSVASQPAQDGDELRALGLHLRSLMSDVAATHSDLQRSRDQLESSEKLASLGRLAASIGHEIRNPLTSIEMRLYSLRGSVRDDPDADEDLRVISEEIARLERIVRNILDFSRPRDLDLAPHHVAVLLEKTLELCGYWLRQQGIEIDCRPDPDLPAVRTDAEQIKQVFLNLLRNSAEAMAGGGRIAIGAARALSQGGRPMVVVRVRDDGRGIPPEALDRILDPFFSTKEDGAGLGLCIAARIMDQHGGWLQLEATGEAGTTFAVWIPVAET